MAKKATCLVTGGSGSFGSILVDLLVEKGYNVKVLDLFPSKNPNVESVTFVRASILDESAIEKALEGIDIVFHCASCLDTSLFVLGDMREQVNVKGTEILLKCCSSSSVKCLIYTSTHNVSFKGETVEMADESLVLSEDEYIDEYSRTKSKAEKLVLSFNRQTNKDNHKILTCAIRPGVIWGKGDRHFEKFLYVSGFGFTFRPPKDIRWDWVSTTDLSRIHFLTAERLYSDSIEAKDTNSEIAGKSFFVGEPDNAVDHWNKILIGLNLSPLYIVLPIWFWIFVGFLSEILAFVLSPILDLKKRWFYWTIPESFKLIKTHTFSNKKWRDQFPNYQPQPIEKTIQQAVEYWRHKSQQVQNDLRWWNYIIVNPIKQIFGFFVRKQDSSQIKKV